AQQSRDVLLLCWSVRRSDRTTRTESDRPHPDSWCPPSRRSANQREPGSSTQPERFILQVRLVLQPVRPCCPIRLCGKGEAESGEVGSAGSLQGDAGLPGVEADEVDGGGGEGGDWPQFG